MSKPKTITINGIKIPISEIKGVTFTRGGNDVYIEKPQPDGPAVIGFRPLAQFTEGKMCKGGQNPPNTSNVRPAPPKGSGGIQ